MLYVFVDIKVDLSHFINTVKHNFEAGTKIAMVSTVQFLSTLQVYFWIFLRTFPCPFKISLRNAVFFIYLLIL